MNDKDFLELVRQMREAQKQYFKTRWVDDLRKSKKLEKQVDDEIANKVQNQLELF